MAQWHEPVKCDLLKKWLQKCQDDSETSNWIAANTKDCPKCQTTIEKNGGKGSVANRRFSIRSRANLMLVIPNWYCRQLTAVSEEQQYEAAEVYLNV